MFGLSNPEGNHGEDVKECYYYLDATPTYSYAKALYKYPQAAFPYEGLREENKRRGKMEPEYEILDTGAFEGDRYFDVLIEYAKAGPDDILISVMVTNRGPSTARVHVLPTLWYRNTWSWGAKSEESTVRPQLRKTGSLEVEANHPTLGDFLWRAEAVQNEAEPTLLFTENDTNVEKL